MFISFVECHTRRQPRKFCQKPFAKNFEYSDGFSATFLDGHVNTLSMNALNDAIFEIFPHDKIGKFVQVVPHFRTEAVLITLQSLPRKSDVFLLIY